MSTSQASGFLRQCSGAFRIARQASRTRVVAPRRWVRAYATQNGQEQPEPAAQEEAKEEAKDESAATSDKDAAEPAIEESEDAKKLKAKEQEVVDLTVRNGFRRTRVLRNLSHTWFVPFE